MNLKMNESTAAETEMDDYHHFDKKRKIVNDIREIRNTK